MGHLMSPSWRVWLSNEGYSLNMRLLNTLENLIAEGVSNLECCQPKELRDILRSGTKSMRVGMGNNWPTEDNMLTSRIKFCKTTFFF